MSRVLLEDVSPGGSAQAVVEDDGTVVFLYLRFAEPVGRTMASCWVRNRLPAPTTLDVEGMKRGQAPMQPAAACADPTLTAPLDEDQLSVVWLQEEDGVALVEGDEILAVIPSWSGMSGFAGYAQNAVGEGPLAWGFAPDNVLRERVSEDRAFWRAWSDGDPWTPFQEGRVAAMEDQLGPYERYFAIDGGTFPPRFLTTYKRDEQVVLVTGGMSQRRQPQAEMVAGAPRRIELGLVLPSSVDIEPWAKSLSAMSVYPWENITWLGPGHTVHGSLPDGFAGYVFDEKTAGVSLALPDVGVERVQVLWVRPLRSAQLQELRAS